MSFFKAGLALANAECASIADLCKVHHEAFPKIKAESDSEIEALTLAAEEMVAAVKAGGVRQYLCLVLDEVRAFVADEDLKCACKQLVKRIGVMLQGDSGIDYSLDEYLRQHADPIFYALTYTSQLLVRLYWIDLILEEPK